ncbi:MAG: hypothetical protein WCI73_07460, partial [Phycisphaerae bacterium]
MNATLATDNTDATLAQVRQAMTPLSRQITVAQPESAPIQLRVTRMGVGPLDTSTGLFHLYDFQVDDRWGQYYALVRADLDSSLMPVFPEAGLVPLRIDSGCCTGQLFHDRTCDCDAQLRYGMHLMAEAGSGILISIPGQDGRGKGLAFKLSTLRLQSDLGWDTVTAARWLANGAEIDDRDYSGAIACLRFLGATRDTQLLLLTGNPEKERALRRNGFTVVTQPPQVAITSQTRRHLQAKMALLGHRVPGLTMSV